MSRLIKRPIVTEKSSAQLGNENTYIFEVVESTNKIELKKEIEKLYSVKVVKINILNRKPKKIRRGRITGKSAARKLAYVTLYSGESIKEVQSLF